MSNLFSAITTITSNALGVLLKPKVNVFGWRHILSDIFEN